MEIETVATCRKIREMWKAACTFRKRSHYPLVRSAYLRYAEKHEQEACRAAAEYAERIASEEGLPASACRAIRDDILCAYFAGYEPVDYYVLDFYRKSEAERYAFISDLEIAYLVSRVSRQEETDVASDKWKAYQLLKPYYGREILRVDGSTEKEELLSFLNKHRDVIVKPYNSFGGTGIHAVSAEAGEYEAAINDIFASSPCLVEERIVQAAEMAMLNPDSVNTVRVIMFRHDDHAECFHVVVRFGKQGSIVDNCHSGGYYAEVDSKTGKYTGSVFGNQGPIRDYRHPNENVMISELQIPRFGELQKLAECVTMKLGLLRYISWDFCLTEDGWKVVEVNAFGGISYVQYNDKIGMKKQICDLFRPYFLK